ncbi:recombinase family protein [Priestia megaterium]|uniref:recombinase family protein n=1 Tax=Priestia megaterium TaxID=1404 RepID=UPI0023DC1341|nr:recombinase family protein [Priestia megaterium]MDF2052722.1 recombinase family protein [Priestia megaterium]MDF2058844.1 recombinase family protein [Priestia megaterium]
MGTNFGYIRVSTNEQNSDRQLEAIKPYVTNEKYSIEGEINHEIFAGVYFT